MIDLFNPAAWGTTATTNVISLILVVVTGVYVFLTWRIAKANQGMLDNIREQYRDSLRPVVFPSLQVRDQVVLTLVITNSGRSPAYRVRISIDCDFFQFAEPSRNIRDFPVFNEEIPVFAPAAELPIDLAQGFNLNKEHEGRNITPSKFNVTVAYASHDQEFEETVPIDIGPYFETHHPKSIGEWLGEIEKHIKKIAQRVS
jgi:hypothetical protein